MASDVPLGFEVIGERLLVETLNKRTISDTYENHWQYHSRSDSHSKAMCWGILFDLLIECPLLLTHVAAGRVTFGINHEMIDSTNRRKKNLDLVLAVPLENDTASDATSFAELAESWGLHLDPETRLKLGVWPPLLRAQVGRVVLAVEAKACMTAHSKAAPRLYDELNSAYQCINGASQDAVAVGHVVVNASSTFISTDQNKKPRAFEDPVVSKHVQPRATEKIIHKVGELPVRGEPSGRGYDGLAISTIRLANDGTPAVAVVGPPALPSGDPRSYASMIHRIASTYNGRFRSL